MWNKYILYYISWNTPHFLSRDVLFVIRIWSSAQNTTTENKNKNKKNERWKNICLRKLRSTELVWWHGAHTTHTHIHSSTSTIVKGSKRKTRNFVCNFNLSDMGRKHFNNQCIFPVFLDSDRLVVVVVVAGVGVGVVVIGLVGFFMYAYMHVCVLYTGHRYDRTLF